MSAFYGKYNIPSWVYTRMALEMHDGASEGVMREIEILKSDVLCVTAQWKCGENAPQLVCIDLHVSELHVYVDATDTDWSSEQSLLAYSKLSS